MCVDGTSDLYVLMSARSICQVLGCRVFLTFEAVGSAFYCWLNGEFVGYSQDSCLPAEFDVTASLQSDRNVLAVQVQ